jgi:hypothetical protein
MRLSFACALLLVSGAASAGEPQEPPAVNPVAEALFQQGRELFKKEQFAEACDKFTESQRLEPKLGTLLNLALCHEKIGKIAAAWAEFTSAEAIARHDGKQERAAFAREEIDALDKKLARVVFKMEAPPSGLTITIDERPLHDVVLGAPLPMDPGKHHVAVTAQGRTPWSVDLEVPAAKVEITLAIPTMPVVAEPPSSAPPPLAPRAVEPPPPPSRAPAALMVAGFGVGAIGLVVGAVTGALTLARSGPVVAACKSGVCPPNQGDALAGVQTLARISDAGFVIAGVGAAVGGAGLVMSLTPRAPVAGTAMLGLRGTF